MTSYLRRLGALGVMVLACVVASGLLARGSVLSGGAVGVAWAQESTPTPTETPTPTPTPTCAAPQSWEEIKSPTSTPMPGVYCPLYWDDPYPEGMVLFAYTIPVWRFDLNNDGNVAGSDTLFLSKYVAGHNLYPTPVMPTATPCSGEGECAPTATPWGGCQVTEAQGIDFVNGVHTLVVLAVVGVPCLVALVLGTCFLMLRRS